MDRVRRLRRAARIILVGAPGVGKGTQTERLIKRYPQLSAISSGDLLRNNVRNRTPLGMWRAACLHGESGTNRHHVGIQAEAKMKIGQLVPDMMMLRLIFNELSTRGWIKPEGPVIPYTLNSIAATEAEIPSSNDPFAFTLPTFPSYSYSDSPTASFILDGFPRNVSQARQIDDFIPINWVVHINTPSEVVLDRISNRWVHAPSGRVYNTTFSPPKVPGTDDITGEPLTRRDDDDVEVWKTRLSNFEQASVPLLEHYHTKGVLWTVNGNTSDEISPKIFMEFERRFGI